MGCSAWVDDVEKFYLTVKYLWEITNEMCGEEAMDVSKLWPVKSKENFDHIASTRISRFCLQSNCILTEYRSNLIQLIVLIQGCGSLCRQNSLSLLLVLWPVLPPAHVWPTPFPCEPLLSGEYYLLKLLWWLMISLSQFPTRLRWKTALGLQGPRLQGRERWTILSWSSWEKHHEISNYSFYDIVIPSCLVELHTYHYNSMKYGSYGRNTYLGPFEYTKNSIFREQWSMWSRASYKNPCKDT